MKQLSEVEQLRLQVELLKVSELDKRIDKVSLIKLVEEYKKTCAVSIILECFGVKRSTFIAGNRCKNSQKRGEIADNGCIEWFHSVLKSETFYLHKWRNITEDSLTDIVKNYIIFYPDNYVSPLK